MKQQRQQYAPIELKGETSLIAARRRSTNFPIRSYDDAEGGLWLFGNEHGVTMVIRARSFDAAWEIAIDEAPTVDDSQVPEAYGFDGDGESYGHGETAADKLRQAVELAEAGDGEYPELVEGYSYQANSTGTGIVDVGHYAWLRPFARDDAREIRLVIRDYECAPAPLHVTFEIAPYCVTMQVEDRGKAKSVRSFDICTHVGERIRRLERVYGSVAATITYAN